jgi:hypothetical protein
MATKNNKNSPASSIPASGGRIEANRKRRLTRTLTQQPNNRQVQVALSESRGHKRKTPKNPYWSHTMIREAKLFKEFTGKMDINIFSSIEATRTNARLHTTRTDWSQVKLPEGRVDFSLGARALGKFA